MYRVCVLTGDSGADATGMFEDDDLLPDIYVGPYLRLQPDLAWVVDVGDHVAGYLLAAADTSRFVADYRAHWLPTFTSRHPRDPLHDAATARVVGRGYEPEAMLGDHLVQFPAHLHIDLLPEAQGRGLGRVLIRTLLTELRRRGIPGVHLGVARENRNAQAFYAHLGFRPVPQHPQNGLLLGLGSNAEV
jgi:ribosomal protein S18 acetylase RimI-like enzyme